MDRLMILLVFLGFIRYITCDGTLQEEKVWSVTGVSGNNSTLPCPLSPRSSGDRPKLILWYKRGVKTPFISYDTRIQSTNANSHRKIHPSKAHLTFTSLTMGDAGMYECRVDFNHSPTNTNLVNLTVIEAPYSVEIFDKFSGSPSDGVLGPYQEGESVILTCLARGGSPRPTISWQDGSVLLTETSTLAEGENAHIIQSDLYLNKLTRHWHDKTLTCSAVNSRLVDPVIAKVRVSMYLLPTSVRITYKKPAREGMMVKLQCQAKGSRPPANIVWTIKNYVINENNQKITKTKLYSLSSITILVSRKENEKEVNCAATNPAISNKVVSNSTLLIVQYAPFARALLGPSLNPDLLKEGDDVYFVCEVEANPPAKDIRWYHEGSELFQKVPEGVLLSSNSLVLQRVKRQRAGKYECSATNELNSTLSSPVFLKVKYKPECVHSPTTYFIYDQPINVTCIVTSHPVATKMNWRWNSGSDVMNIRPFSSVLEKTADLVQPSSPLEMFSSSKIDGKAAGVLTVYPSKNSEDRELSCWAENEMGEQGVPCIFSIKVAQIPAPLSSCRLANVTSSSLSLTCEKPSGAPLESTFYRADLYLDNKTLFSNVTSRRPNFNVSSLDPGTNYQIKVYVSRGPVTSLPVVVSASTFRQSRVEASTSGASVMQPIYLIMIFCFMSSYENQWHWFESFRWNLYICNTLFQLLT